jgi:hypothetical protein
VPNSFELTFSETRYLVEVDAGGVLTIWRASEVTRVVHGRGFVQRVGRRRVIRDSSPQLTIGLVTAIEERLNTSG